METSKNNIQMRLLSVSEVKFFMDQNIVAKFTDAQNITLGFANTVFPDIDNNTISIDFGIRYFYKNNTALESVYKFTFFVEKISKYVTKNDDGGGYTINSIMPHMLSVAAGTMRGIILVKSFGTNIAKYPLPMLDIMQLNKNLSHLNK